ncbi:MAG TPA: hypothetical protein VN637_12880, partial [Roseiarcus sp.]|nr:hypothetical protein [Roseiarcus sp.]
MCKHSPDAIGVTGRAMGRRLTVVNMADPAKLSWTETDLNDLIGQSESTRREFKSGRLFDGNQESKWVEQLSKEVSALANTEGGELFLG